MKARIHLNQFPCLSVMSVCHPAGALVVTLRQGVFKGREEGFIESLLTGGYPDPYVVISVLENEDTLAPETVASKVLRAITGREAPVRPEKKTTFARVLDSARSGQKVSYCVRHLAYNHSRDEALEFGVQDLTSMSRLARVPTVFSVAGEADGHYHRHYHSQVLQISSLISLVKADRVSSSLLSSPLVCSARRTTTPPRHGTSRTTCM